jgi:putative protease
MGFKRIVLGRETSLAEIREIKDAVPEMELEAFVHGAMCIAYSGRCLLSAYLAGRSANAGYCSHTCRWDYRVLAKMPQNGQLYIEEKQRPNEFFPVFEGENFTAILSSKDLCMIDHLADLQAAGVDALKIEGRMKSVYYTALVTRAYRKALDALAGKISQGEADPFIRELYNTSHREFSTGFYYSRSDADSTTTGEPSRTYQLAGIIGANRKGEEGDKSLSPLFDLGFAVKNGWHFYNFIAMNKFEAGVPLEVITPTIAAIPLGSENYRLINPETGEERAWVSHGHPCLLYTPLELAEGDLVRIGLKKQ